MSLHTRIASLATRSGGLGLAMGALGALPAAEIADGLTMDGYVDSVSSVADADDAVNPDGDVVIDFTAFAQFDVEYRVGDEITARMELSYDEDGFDEDNFEEAHVTWALGEQVGLIAGKFENWIGWEGADAPELYRVNPAWVTSGGTIATNGDPVGLFGINTTGVGVIVTPAAGFEAGLFVVDAIYDEPTDRPTDSVSLGGYLDYAAEGVGSFQLDAMYGADERAGEEDILGLDLWGEIDALREDAGLLFAFDVNYTDFDSDSALAILVMANYEFDGAPVPMSATLMLDWIDPYQDDTGPQGADDDSFEVAVALLTHPTSDEHVAFTVEARSIFQAADDSDEFGLFVELLAIIP